MAFTQQVWQEVAPLRGAILAHPFLHELAQGTLAKAAFERYIVQDSLYLADYARTLALAAARAPSPAARFEFSDGAKVAVQVEEALHQSFFQHFGLEPAQAHSATANPTCLAYTSYLNALAATRSYEVLIAGILPCFWVYWEVGVHIKAKAPNLSKTQGANPYQAWIDTYADPGFGATTQRVIALVDAAAESVNAQTRTQMAQAFTTATRYEWMFWNAAYTDERWPI
jgi:thiaminase (transcriptional activator TenA)